MIGTKADCETERQVSKEEAKTFAEDILACKTIEVSSKTAIGCEESYKLILELVYNYHVSLGWIGSRTNNNTQKTLPSQSTNWFVDNCNLM